MSSDNTAKQTEWTEDRDRLQVCKENLITIITNCSRYSSRAT